MLKHKYQTKNQVLLDILYEEVLVELMESNQRAEFLKSKDDEETLLIELEINKEIATTLEQINSLVKSFKGAYSTASTTVEIGNNFAAKDDWKLYTSREL